MNVLLYVPPPPPPMLGNAFPRIFPIGPLVIATYAKHAGHNVEIVDCNASKSLAEVARGGFVPDVLGISLLTMYGILDADGIRGFIAEVRKIAAPVIVWGGAGASVLSEILLNEKLADYVVLGPGEEVFAGLLSGLETGCAVSGIPGVAYLDAGACVRTARTKCGGTGLSLPLDYSLVDMARHITNRQGRGFPVCTSRGCKYRCTFCYNESFYACSYQTRPVPVVIAEMKFLNEQYGITDFQIMDECFGSDKAWLYAFCNAMIAELPAVTWWCQHHGGMKTREDYELMRKAGCREVCIGVESADPHMSLKIRKGIDLSRIPAEIDLLHALGMSAMAAFIFGFPGETREQLLRTCAFMLSCKADIFYINGFYLIPDTKIFEELESGGRVTMPKTLAEFQAFLSPKRYPNYSNVPERELKVVLGFFNLAWRLALLFENGRILRNLRTYAKLQGRGDKRFLFSSLMYFVKMLWHVAAHPLIRKRYGLWFRHFKRHSPSSPKN